MSDKVFIDTNLWVYFFVKDPLEKGDKVGEIIDSQVASLTVSTQVLGELYNVLTRKSTFSQSEVQSIVLDLVNTFSILEIDTPKVLKALEINARYGYSYWDSLIIATSLQSDCGVLYSEDMQHNQVIENQLRIINPFVS